MSRNSELTNRLQTPVPSPPEVPEPDAPPPELPDEPVVPDEPPEEPAPIEPPRTPEEEPLTVP